MPSVIEKLKAALYGIENRGDKIGQMWIRKSVEDDIARLFSGQLRKAEPRLDAAFMGVKYRINDQMHADLDVVINGPDGRVIGVIYRDKEIKKVAKKGK